MTTAPLTARLHAHPLTRRLHRLGFPSLAAAGVPGGFKSALAFDVSERIAA